MADSLNEDMLDVLELRESQLTDMIKMLQRKRRDVRAAIVRLKAETLSPVAEEVSGGNNEVCTCRREGLRFHKDSCPERVS